MSSQIPAWTCGWEFHHCRSNNLSPSWEAVIACCDARPKVNWPTRVLARRTSLRAYPCLVTLLPCRLEDEWAAPGPAANSSDTWQAGEAAALAGGAPRPATPAQAPAHAAAPAGPRRLRPGCPLRPLGADLAGSPPPSAAAPRRALGPWERASRKLSVNLEARAALAQLLPYVEGEVAALSDQDMRQEVDLLRLLAGQ